MAVDEDLDLLEKSIRQLQIEWEKFFGGVERKPPSDLKGRVEAMIRKHAYAELRNNTERFRYQALTARYNTFNELWTKRLRATEEGRPVGLHGIYAQAAAPPLTPAPVEKPTASPASKEVRVQNPEQDDAAVRSLFERFLEARRASGESTAVRFDSFQKLITQQASRILTEKGARAVDFRLETKDGKVSLKAKPVR